MVFPRRGQCVSHCPQHLNNFWHFTFTSQLARTSSQCLGKEVKATSPQGAGIPTLASLVMELISQDGSQCWLNTPGWSWKELLIENYSLTLESVTEKPKGLFPGTQMALLWWSSYKFHVAPPKVPLKSCDDGQLGLQPYVLYALPSSVIQSKHSTPYSWVHWSLALSLTDQTPGCGKHTAKTHGSLLRGSGTPKPGSCGAFVVHSTDVTKTPPEPPYPEL